MRTISIQAFGLLTAGAVLLLSGHGVVAPDDPAEFAVPKRIKAGDAFMGEGRLYPSPVVRDMNGDGIADIVIGDLFGKVTVAGGTAGGATPAFAADEPMKGRDGGDLKFHNW